MESNRTLTHIMIIGSACLRFGLVSIKYVHAF